MMNPTLSPDNPFLPLLQECSHDQFEIRKAYETNRLKSIAQQTELSKQGINVDPILEKIVKDPGFVDERNGITFSARAPESIRDVIGKVQDRLRSVCPSQAIWYSPPELLHLTLLEITHSQPFSALEPLLALLKPLQSTLRSLILSNPSTLDSPIVKIDKTAISISFLPSLPSRMRSEGKEEEEGRGYHLIRGLLYDKAVQNGVPIKPRYVYPSAHMTIARFTQALSEEEIKALVEEIVKIDDEKMLKGVEWVVVEVETLLQTRFGEVWYGGGTIL